MQSVRNFDHRNQEISGVVELYLRVFKVQRVDKSTAVMFLKLECGL